MSCHDHEYARVLRQIIDEGETCADRTGVGTRAIFGAQMRFPLGEKTGFPLLTTKRVFWKGIVEELLWFLRGSTNAHELSEKGVHIWAKWADEDGELGPVYGKQWRAWRDPFWDEWEPVGEGFQALIPGKLDQIDFVIKGLIKEPFGRRHIVTAWNPAEIDDAALPPCHVLFQFRVSPSGKLSCQLYQRSADFFLGVPFNIASYALLTHMVAHVTGYEVGDFIWTGGDCHVYLNHLEQVKEQLSRTPFKSPELLLNLRVTDIDDFTAEDISLLNYMSHPPIKAEVAV